MTRRIDIPVRLIYTCNCGWFDKGHAFVSKPPKRPYVSAVSLWNQIKDGETKGVKSVKAGAKGFLVIYRQDQYVPVVGIPLGNVTRQYFVQSGLTLQEKESVALAIFKEVSMAFEELQSTFPDLPVVSVINSSGFSAEDLVSNLVGFYKVVRPMPTPTDVSGKPLTDPYSNPADSYDPEADPCNVPRDPAKPPKNIDYYFNWCQQTSCNESLQIWDKFGGVGEEHNKNRAFIPKFFVSKECPEPLGTNSTAARQALFKTMFDVIPTATKGQLFRDWTIEDFFKPEDIDNMKKFYAVG